MRMGLENFKSNERGAALVTVVMISLLLLTACVAMLSAVGANSRNSTDVLSETKAYYAAESGLQATVNVLRNKIEGDGTFVTYSEASADPDLSTWLPYNYPTTGSADRVVVGDTASYTPNSGTAYAVSVRDPDNSGVSTTFFTNGAFFTGGPGTLSGDGRTMYVPNNTVTNYTEITFSNAASTTVTFAGNPANPILSTFQITNHGSGAQLALGVKAQFGIEIHMTGPRPYVTMIRGSLEPAVANGPPVVLKFVSQRYDLLGGKLELCPTATRPSVSPGCTNVEPTLTAGVSYPVYAFITPVLPYRLVVSSTGYGPNGATKKLEAVLQKNLANGVANGAATTMLGPPCVPTQQLPCFDPGNSNNVAYSGGNCTTTGCVPSFGFNNPANLQLAMNVLAGNNPPTMTPPPALLTTEVPEWQQSPANLDVLIDRYRIEAQRPGGRYLNPASSSAVADPGDFTSGTGITFCEGSCKVSGSGGGTLIVTGKLTNVGGFSFKGLIIVTGEEGWERSGGGGGQPPNGQIIGNVLIAPYNRIPYRPENLSATFLPPHYYITGGGASDIIYQDVSAQFDSISSISDFVIGVAEK